MKTIKLTLMIITLCTWCGYSQSIEKFSIDSGGASTSAGGLQILYVIGEVNVAEQISGDLSVSEGFISGGLLNTLDVNDVDVSVPQIEIYPNPASDVIHINSDIQFTKIEIYDMLGKQVFKSSYLNKINVEQYKSGIYILKMYANDNQFISKRIVIN
ncbi:T9SS type A sorting domain-containing protein [Algibacter sp. L4_22]|uniref:T9SS type A sorting domain-containing protein n=1 Tax=Algibacter sp. L4_22 TaxID=2942477 RepID=UPI00201B9290|nr:T9SS type A sorting domain-containing protein [Algibacter sp. L4_22]MCL5128124.1 T9SS type A sorting domain-containing protein [Algibacter sp. L4_22]